MRDRKVLGGVRPLPSKGDMTKVMISGEGA